MRVRFYLTCLRFLVYLASMSEEEINVAIAECLGWTGPFEKCWLYGYGREGEDVWAFCGTDADGERDKLPNYCGDLNAMSDVVQTLNEYQSASFECRLVEIVTDGVFNMKKHPVAEMHYVDALSAMHATAKQRAEAFLRTLGKWIE